jgi:transmembrane sensor
VNDNTPRIPEAMAQAAADWIVRRDGGPLSPGDERRFQAWLATPAHRDAFARLEGVWGMIGGEAATRPRQSGRWIGAAVAASLALVVLGALNHWPVRLRADYATDVGQRQAVTLADGSRVTLDSGSAIAVKFSGKERRVELLAGAALFQVAPDRAHPFTVEAAGGAATALGTAFAIRREGDRADIVVTQHSVAVVGDGRSEIVSQGQRADFSTGTLGPVHPADKGATAWTRGQLVVVDRPLGEVVGEIARYRRGYLDVSASAARIRVSGVYDLDHPLVAIDSIERSLHLASFRLSDRIIVLHR